MTPLGHASISYLASRTSAKLSVTALLIGGLLPDIDYLFVLAPWFNQIHRAITHNLLFTFLIAAIGFFVVPKHRRKSVFAGLLLGGALHLFADSIIDGNPSNGIGVAILWPFQQEYYFSPFNLAKTDPGSAGWTDVMSSVKGALSNIPWEIPLYLGAAFVLWKRRK